MKQFTEVLDDMYIPQLPPQNILCVGLSSQQEEYIRDRYSARTVTAVSIDDAAGVKYDALVCAGNVFGSDRDAFDDKAAALVRENGMLGILLPADGTVCADWYTAIKNSGRHYSDAHFFRLCEGGIGITARGI